MSLSYPEAIVVGLFQGVTELFPVSSLGHSILLPALVGGQWSRDLSVSAPESPYLAFVVGLHVATAIALLVFYWRDWVAVVGGLVSSLRYRRVDTENERLAWFLIVATIPVGIAGLALEHFFRTTLGRPVPAALFLIINGGILLFGDWLRRRQIQNKELVTASAARLPATRAAPQLGFALAIQLGLAQCLALLPGISRSGATMVGGLARGLTYPTAARLSFMLATPVIFAAGVLKVPDLFGPLGDGIRGQVAVGSLVSGLAAYAAVRFLSRYFQSHKLAPYAYYCLALGAGSLVVLAV